VDAAQMRRPILPGRQFLPSGLRPVNHAGVRVR
jgi:hypothetical protein